MTPQTSDLLDRVRRGNDWCRVAWQRCCDAADGDKQIWRRNLAMFHAGTKRLYILCLQLEVSGYEKCLYEKPLCVGTTQIICYACPAKHYHEALLGKFSQKQLTDLTKGR